MDSLSSDSACYSAKENEGITRGLLELSERRKQDAILELRMGYCTALGNSIRTVLAKDKGFFLWRRKRLARQVDALVNQVEGKP